MNEAIKKEKNIMGNGSHVRPKRLLPIKSLSKYRQPGKFTVDKAGRTMDLIGVMLSIRLKEMIWDFTTGEKREIVPESRNYRS